MKWDPKPNGKSVKSRPKPSMLLSFLFGMTIFYWIKAAAAADNKRGYMDVAINECREKRMAVLIFVDRSVKIEKGLFEDIISVFIDKPFDVLNQTTITIQPFDVNCEKPATFDRLTGAQLIEAINDLIVRKAPRRRREAQTNCHFPKMETSSDANDTIISTVFILDNFITTVNSRSTFGDYLKRGLKDEQRRFVVINLGKSTPSYPWTILPSQNFVNIKNSVFFRSHLMVLMCSVCPKGWKPFYRDSKRSCFYYGYSKIPINANEAHQKCENDHGGYIASFQSPERWSAQYTEMLDFAMESSDHRKKSDMRHFNLSFHIGMRRRPNLWGGWMLYWDTGISVTLKRDYEADYFQNNAGQCIIAFFRDCSPTFRRCKSIHEEPVTCWNKTSKFYMCNIPKAIDDSYSKYYLIPKKPLTPPKIQSNVRICYFLETMYIYMPVYRNHPENINCVRNEYIINNKVVQDLSVIEQIPKFHCSGADKRAISYHSLCNLFNDCPNKEDEKDECYVTPLHQKYNRYKPCSKLEFQCANKQCIPLEAQCDLVQDCYDGSDEQDCRVCKHITCPSGVCIPKSVAGDGVEDCPRLPDLDVGSEEAIDEVNGSKNACFVICNRTSCVDMAHMITNDVTDCQGPEGPLDIILRSFTMTKCEGLRGPKAQYGPKCLYILDRFKVVIGCRNFYHLNNCAKFKCPDGYYKCANGGYCIPIHYIQNGMHDCPLGEDEGVDLVLPAFLCLSKDRQQYVQISQVCDGSEDCVDGSDELDCNIPCMKGFLCMDGAVVALKDQTEPIHLDRFDFIRDSIKYLDLSGVNMRSSIHHFYEPSRFRALLYLYLSNCGLRELSSTNATKLRLHNRNYHSVKYLDLSQNSLKRATTYSFVTTMIYLKFLNLSGNRDLLYPERFINYHDYLEVLDLSYTGLTKVPFQLKELIYLKHLNVTGCNLMVLRKGLFPLSLHSLYMFNLPTNLYITAALFEGFRNMEEIIVDRPSMCCSVFLGTSVHRKVCQSASEDPVFSCGSLVPESGLVVLSFLIAGLALILNLIAMIHRVMADTKFFETPQGLILTHLNIGNCLIPINLFIVNIADTSFGENYAIEERTWIRSQTCATAAVIYRTGFVVTSLLTTLLAIDRYVAARYPFSRSRVKDMRLFAFSCFLSWILSVCVAVLPVQDDLWALMYSQGICNIMPFFYQPRRNLPTTIGFTGFVLTEILQIFLALWGLHFTYKVFFREKRYFLPTLKALPIDCLAASLYSEEKTKAKRSGIVVAASTYFLAVSASLEISVLVFDTYLGRNIVLTALVILPLNCLMEPIFYTIPRIWEKTSAERAEESRKLSESVLSELSKQGSCQLSSAATCMHLLNQVALWIRQAQPSEASNLLVFFYDIAKKNGAYSPSFSVQLGAESSEYTFSGLSGVQSLGSGLPPKGETSV